MEMDHFGIILKTGMGDGLPLYTAGGDSHMKCYFGWFTEVSEK